MSGLAGCRWTMGWDICRLMCLEDMFYLVCSAEEIVDRRWLVAQSPQSRDNQSPPATAEMGRILTHIWSSLIRASLSMRACVRIKCFLFHYIFSLCYHFHKDPTNRSVIS